MTSRWAISSAASVECERRKYSSSPKHEQYTLAFGVSLSEENISSFSPFFTTSRHPTRRRPSQRESCEACRVFELPSPFLRVSFFDIALITTAPPPPAYTHNPQLTALNNKLLMSYVWQYKSIRGWTSPLRLALFHVSRPWSHQKTCGVKWAQGKWRYSVLCPL